MTDPALSLSSAPGSAELRDQLYRYAEDLQQLVHGHRQLVERYGELEDSYRRMIEAISSDEAGGDLDSLLVRLDELLRRLPALRILAQSAILLYTPDDELLQVAQFGLVPAWAVAADASGVKAARGVANAAGAAVALAGQAYLSTPARHVPALRLAGVVATAPLLVLPLRNDGQALGAVVLLIEPGWQPAAAELAFMSDLALSLSARVMRVLIEELLAVRGIELAAAHSDVFQRLSQAAELRDDDTGMHLLRMARYASAIAKVLGLPAEVQELLLICAPMHDVGKIGISDTILLKPGRLSEAEFEVMKSHAAIGERLLHGEDKLMAAARDIAGAHHERWDGGGYPNGLAGEAIPLLARICAIADVFDALTSERPYKKAWSIEEACALVRGQSGLQFDPALVAAFERALPQILHIRERFRDEVIDPRQVLALPKLAPHATRWVEWGEELATGIEVIDEHHRYLFELTNDLFEVVTQKRGAGRVVRVLEALLQYVEVHFRAEERMMAHHGFAALERQQAQHRHFEARLHAFYNELRRNPITAPLSILLYLRDWLVQHILHEDVQLRALVAPVA